MMNSSVTVSAELGLSLVVPDHGSVPLVAGLIAHFIIRRVAPYADPLLLPCVVLLNGLGLVMIHRLDLGQQQAARQNGTPVPSATAPSQIVWTAI